MKQITFVVTIKYPDVLETSVVRNYVNMAIKKYDKAIYKLDQSPYFDGVRQAVSFNITEIPDADPANLRQTIAQIQTMAAHFEGVS